MKKHLITLILFFFLVIPASFGSVNMLRQAPREVEIGEIITVQISIHSNEELNNFDIIEFTPVGWNIIDWDIENYNRDSIVFERLGVREYENRRRSHFHWQFLEKINEGEEIILSYEIEAIDRGSMEFLTVFMHKDGIIDRTSSLNVIRTEPPPPIEEEIYEIDVYLILSIFSIVFLIFLSYFGYKKIKMWRIKRKKSKAEKVAEKIYETDKYKTSNKKPIEDLRLFIKYGIQKGYKLGELVDALKGDGVNTELIEKIIEKDEIKDSVKKRKVYPEQEVIRKIKDFIENLSKEEEEKIRRELEK